MKKRMIITALSVLSVMGFLAVTGDDKSTEIAMLQENIAMLKKNIYKLKENIDKLKDSCEMDAVKESIKAVKESIKAVKAVESSVKTVRDKRIALRVDFIHVANADIRDVRKILEGLGKVVFEVGQKISGSEETRKQEDSREIYAQLKEIYKQLKEMDSLLMHIII